MNARRGAESGLHIRAVADDERRQPLFHALVPELAGIVGGADSGQELEASRKEDSGDTRQVVAVVADRVNEVGTEFPDATEDPQDGRRNLGDRPAAIEFDDLDARVHKPVNKVPALVHPGTMQRHHVGHEPGTIQPSHQFDGLPFCTSRGETVDEDENSSRLHGRPEVNHERAQSSRHTRDQMRLA